MFDRARVKKFGVELANQFETRRPLGCNKSKVEERKTAFQLNQLSRELLAGKLDLREVLQQEGDVVDRIRVGEPGRCGRGNDLQEWALLVRESIANRALLFF